MIPSVDSKCSGEESQTQVSSLLSQQKVFNGIILTSQIIAEKIESSCNTTFKNFCSMNEMQINTNNK